MQLIDCDYQRHAGAMLSIFNTVIDSSTAMYDYQHRSPADMYAWFNRKQAGGYPVLGAESDQGVLMGFATYGRFRDWPAYKYTVEHSVYVQADCRGRGVAVQLMQALIDRAMVQGYHMMVGCIDGGNAASVRLHEKLGFTHAGTLRHAGFKFGRWLDLAFYQKILPTPAEPTDG